MSLIQTAVISPCLWFDHQAEEAATHYVGIFPNAKIHKIARYPNVGQDVHGREAGSVMTVEFELEGVLFCASTPGLHSSSTRRFRCRFSATRRSRSITTGQLGEGGGGRSVQCGWLKDRYGVSWQVAPRVLGQLAVDPDPVQAARVFGAMTKMVKIDLAQIEQAANGG
jgi:predicted 3-demethylubiquinone-9 3-methyltransferase (glyoxalase superfamily)